MYTWKNRYGARKPTWLQERSRRPRITPTQTPAALERAIVRFRDSVLPGDRLIVMCRLSKVRRGRMIICDFQGVVKDRIVVEGVLKGVPIPVEAVREFMAKRQA